MKFHVIDHNVRITPKAETMAYLRKDNWNDFSFQTLFRLEVVEKRKKNRHRFRKGSLSRANYFYPYPQKVREYIYRVI